MLQPHIETHGAHSGKYSDTLPLGLHPRLFFEQLAFLGAFLFTMRPSVKYFEEFMWVSFKFSLWVSFKFSFECMDNWTDLLFIVEEINT